jgi:hypothetical protein
LIFTLGCSRPSDNIGQNSSIKIKIPSSSQFKKIRSSLKSSSKLNSLAGSLLVDNPIDYDRLCFLVNVSGGNITPVSQDLTCNISRGIVKGTVAAGQELSLDVPSNQSVNFELYGYLRNSLSDTCPEIIDPTWSWPLDKVYQLGITEQVQIVYPQTDVTINIDLPMASQNIVVANVWPNTCLPSSVQKDPLPPVGRIALGGKLLTGTQYKMFGRITAKEDSKNLLGVQFKINSWKAK